MGLGFSTRVDRKVEGEPLKVLPHPGCTRKELKWFVRLSTFTSIVRVGVHVNNLTNVLRGLRERVFAVEVGGKLVSPPKPTKGIFKSLGLFRAELLRVVRHCHPWTDQQFVDSYTGAKRRLVEAAVASIADFPVCRRDANLKTFVKAEKLNLTSKPDPAPRVIQPRDPRYNAAVGPYLKSAEHPIYWGIAEVWGGPTVMKGYNAGQVGAHMRAMWETVPNPAAIGLDASRFDQHVSREALEWEHGVYNSMYRSPELAKWLEWQIHNRGSAYVDGAVVRYDVEGCRMSGDMNTALGNCLIMCAMVWEFCRERGIKARLANNGDDCVLFIDRSQEHLLEGLGDWFLGYGFTMKQEPTVYEFQQVEFCQAKPIRGSDGEWIMTRNPVMAIAKDTTWITPTMDDVAKGFVAWAHSVGIAGRRAYGDMPILGAHYARYARLVPTQGVQGFGNMATGFEYMVRGLNRPVTDPSPESRYDVWVAWGYTPDEQVAIEEELLATPTDFIAVPMISEDQSGIRLLAA